HRAQASSDASTRALALRHAAPLLSRLRLGFDLGNAHQPFSMKLATHTTCLRCEDVIRHVTVCVCARHVLSMCQVHQPHVLHAHMASTCCDPLSLHHLGDLPVMAMCSVYAHLCSCSTH